MGCKVVCVWLINDTRSSLLFSRANYSDWVIHLIDAYFDRLLEKVIKQQLGLVQFMTPLPKLGFLLLSKRL
jgi:hypothetical protein